MSQDPLPYATPAGKAYPQSFGRQVFGVIVRTVGLLLAIYGAHTLVLAALDVYFDSYGTDLTKALQFVDGGFYAAAGVVLLIRAGWVVNLAYRRDE